MDNFHPEDTTKRNKILVFRTVPLKIFRSILQNLSVNYPDSQLVIVCQRSVLSSVTGIISVLNLQEKVLDILILDDGVFKFKLKYIRLIPRNKYQMVCIPLNNQTGAGYWKIFIFAFFVNYNSIRTFWVKDRDTGFFSSSPWELWTNRTLCALSKLIGSFWETCKAVRFSTQKGYSLFTPVWLVNTVGVHYLEKFISEIDIQDGLLLDIGCGEKPFSSLFNGKIKKYIGIDYPSTCISSKKVDILGDGRELPIKTGCGDVVFSMAVLEHIDEPDKYLSEILRVLKPHGTLIISVPHMWYLHMDPNDFCRFTRYGIHRLLEKTGFRVIKLKANSGYWVTTGIFFCHYLARSQNMFIIGMVIRCLYALVNILTFFLDRLDRQEQYTWAYTISAVKNDPYLSETEQINNE